MKRSVLTPLTVKMRVKARSTKHSKYNHCTLIKWSKLNKIVTVENPFVNSSMFV